MSFDRILFFDGCNLNNRSVIDSVNNYAEVRDAHSVLKKGEIIQALQNGRKYRLITIAGHAAKNEIAVGAGMFPTNDKTKEISLKKFSDSKQFFKEFLKKYFEKSQSTPILFLAGCEIYDFLDAGDSLPKRISLAVKDVLVIAPSTLVRPKLADNVLKIKFDVKPGKGAEFDFDLTLAAYRNGEKMDDMRTILEMTKCQDEHELQKLLCEWDRDQESVH